MKIQILEACGIAGVGHPVGAIVDAPERDARYVVAIGKAKFADGVPAPAAQIQTTETAAAVVSKRRGK